MRPSIDWHGPSLKSQQAGFEEVSERRVGARLPRWGCGPSFAHHSYMLQACAHGVRPIVSGLLYGLYQQGAMQVVNLHGGGRPDKTAFADGTSARATATVDLHGSAIVAGCLLQDFQRSMLPGAGRAALELSEYPCRP